MTFLFKLADLDFENISPKEFYDYLGISMSASESEYKKAYRRRAAQLHPDKQGGDTAKMQGFNAAAETFHPDNKASWGGWAASRVKKQTTAKAPESGPTVSQYDFWKERRDKLWEDEGGGIAGAAARYQALETGRKIKEEADRNIANTLLFGGTAHGFQIQKSYNQYQEGRTGEAFGRTLGQILGAGVAVGAGLKKDKNRRVALYKSFIKDDAVKREQLSNRLFRGTFGGNIGGVLGSYVGQFYDEKTKVPVAFNAKKHQNAVNYVVSRGFDPNSDLGRKMVESEYNRRGGVWHMKKASFSNAINNAKRNPVLAVSALGVAAGAVGQAHDTYQLFSITNKERDLFEKVDRNLFRNIGMLDEVQLKKFKKWKIAKDATRGRAANIMTGAAIGALMPDTGVLETGAIIGLGSALNEAASAGWVRGAAAESIDRAWIKRKLKDGK